MSIFYISHKYLQAQVWYIRVHPRHFPKNSLLAILELVFLQQELHDLSYLYMFSWSHHCTIANLLHLQLLIQAEPLMHLQVKCILSQGYDHLFWILLDNLKLCSLILLLCRGNFYLHKVLVLLYNWRHFPYYLHCNPYFHIYLSNQQVAAQINFSNYFLKF